MDNTPEDWYDPVWSEGGKVHNWHNHVSKGVQELWSTFTEEQKKAIARQANELAIDEEWD